MAVKTLQQGLGGYSGVADTEISSWSPDKNAGGVGEFVVRTGNQKSALLMFGNLPAPANATLLEAKLELYVTRASAHEVTLQAFPVLRLWYEGQATWLRPRIGDLWSVPGCDGPWVDRAGSPAPETTASQPGTWVSLDITETAQQWVSTPGANHGILLKLSAALAAEYSFASSEYWTASLGPRLILRYSAP